MSSNCPTCSSFKEINKTKGNLWSRAWFSIFFQIYWNKKRMIIWTTISTLFYIKDSSTWPIWICRVFCFNVDLIYHSVTSINLFNHAFKSDHKCQYVYVSSCNFIECQEICGAVWPSSMTTFVSSCIFSNVTMSLLLICIW